MTKKGVHKNHCCIHHGCKYGDKDCPVVNGSVIQTRPCDECNLSDYTLERIKQMNENKGDIDANYMEMFKEVVTLGKENKTLKTALKRLIEGYSMYIRPDDLREFINLIDSWGEK